MGQQSIDIKYLIDKLIESGEKNLDLQNDTLSALHEIKQTLVDRDRDHTDIKDKLEDIIDVSRLTAGKMEAVEHRGTVKKIESLLECQSAQCIPSLNTITAMVKSTNNIYRQVRFLLAILSGIVTIGIAFLAIIRAF